MSVTDGRLPCEACDGDGELGVSGHSTYREAKRIERLYLAASGALRMARRYRAECAVRREPWREDRRILAVLVQVRRYRDDIGKLRRQSVGPAWCIACRGTGLESIDCEGCGRAVDQGSVDVVPLECVDVLVHRGCDTGDGFFERSSP